MDWSKMVKMTVPVGLCGWQQRGSLTINGRTTEFPVGVETELPEPVAERIKALIADAEEKAEHVQPLKPWMQHVTGADGVARWEPRIDKPGDPHQYLTTDGDGKPHWEDKLAYDETRYATVVPTTHFTTWGSAPQSVNVENIVLPRDGSTCRITLDEQVYECEATVSAEDMATLKVTSNLTINVYVNRFFIVGTPSGDEHTIHIEEIIRDFKPIDPKYLPSGSGGGGVMYIEGTESLIVPAYADDALTTMLSYDQAKEIIQKPFAVCMNIEGMRVVLYPAIAIGDDSQKKVNIVIITHEAGSAAGVTLTFSDTTA